ncbi:metallophosphoesterase [Candidatus Saganbacteria bacterium CG08_land_8_20_14_0_20_45_16]|uniref:Metallophosphoesterase n=1 Tax=Candidatus Saganbacteria bacterium CG08_land_8_20_14_0_20_45_16 TaxID=2014293 RepID=A0A2H0Y061_UNCSA|nr:MAG: metallophosphoesterase [Candidatus Saganbacteria bacterium CG08_land_8_20_14_0_20_45_16]
MLYGIISDIHSNLEALEAVLASLKVDQIICLGDVVGYGPSPNECVERLRALGIPMLAGNHEKALLGELSTEWFNKNAKAAIDWTRQVISPENQEFLKSLPALAALADFVYVHGSLRDPVNEYILSLSEALPSFELMKSSFCFVGHTHRPGYFARKKDGFYDTQTLRAGDEVLIDNFDRVIINPGSVGQPRDSDSRAAFGIYDDSLRIFSLQRVVYDIASVQAKMRAAQLPQGLIDRLAP